MPGAGPEVSRPPRTAQQPSGLRRGREGVLAAATSLFLTRGYDATSMGDIAEHVGVTKAALYRHVSGKAELLDAVTRPMREAVLALLGSCAQVRGQGFDTLAGLLRGLADVAADDPAGHALLWAARGTSAGFDQDSACREAVFRRLVDLLEQAVAEGDVRDDIALPLIARLLLGAVAGANCLPDEPVSPSHSAVAALLGGLRPASVAG
ncbi:TetR/AcrR family transcriptional regulator [Streptomyces sp. 4N124]|uniref:TetR/AcrR family transcriptional regulator n=1 Tax=Streptomyces sp. 4N124 TaxID=3457420 RepID=UPI003FD102EF